jgi:hypothetical protein
VAAALAAASLLAQPKKVVVTSSGYYYSPFSPSAIQELRAARKLKWVQAGVAGVERFLTPELRHIC